MNLRRLLTIIIAVLVAGLFLAPHDTVNLIEQFFHAVTDVFHSLNLH